MVEQVIERLLDVRNGRPGKPVQLTEGQIRQLCLMAKEVFLAQPNLLELEAPIKICGEHVFSRAPSHLLFSEFQADFSETG